MPGMYKYSMEIESNVKKLLLDTKELQDRMDTLEGKEYKINLNIDEKKLGNVISNLEKMLDSLGKGTGDFKQFENLSKELSSIVSEVQSLSKAFGKVDDSGTKTLLSSIQNIDKSLSELSQNILNVNKNMSNMGGNTSGAVKQVENISDAYQNAAKEAEKLADAQSKIGQKTNISSGDSKEQSTEIDLYHNLEKRKVTYDEIIDKIQTIISLKEKEKSLSKTSDDTKLYQKLYDENDINWAGDTEGTINRISDRLKEIYIKYNGKISLINENDIQEAAYLLDILKGAGESPNLNKSQEKFYQNKKFSNDSLFDNIHVDSQKTGEIDKINTELSETYRWFNQLEGVSLNENIANEIKSLISDMQIGGKNANEYANDLLKIFNIEVGSNSVVEQQNKLQSELKETESQAEKTTMAVKEVSSTASTEQKKDAFPNADAKPETEGMKQVEEAIHNAVQAKKDFATANEGVQSSIDDSENPLKLEAELMGQIAKSAREAADAKKEFVEANKQVKDSANNSNNDLVDGHSENAESSGVKKYKKKGYKAHDTGNHDNEKKVSNKAELGKALKDLQSEIIASIDESTSFVKEVTDFYDSQDNLVKTQMKIGDKNGSMRTYTTSYSMDKDGNATAWTSHIETQKIAEQAKQEEKLTQAMAKGREQAEKARQAEEKRQELAQNNAINKALEEEYKQRQKLEQEEEKQIQKNKELAMSYTESASKKLSDAISKYSYGDSSDATAMMKQMNRGLSNFGDLSNIESNIKNFDSIVDTIITDLKHSHEESLFALNNEIKAEETMQKQKDAFNKSNLNAIDMEIKKREEEAKVFSNSLKAQMESQQQAESQMSKFGNILSKYQTKTSGYDATIDRFNDGGWTSDTYLKNVQAVKDAVNEYETLLNELKGKDASLVTSDDISKLDEYEKKIKDTIATVTNMSAAEKGYNFVSGQKELDKIHKLLNENSKMSSEAKAKIRAYYTEIESGNPSMSLDRIHGEIMKIYNAEVEAGRAGRSFFDTLKNSGFHQLAAQMSGMFGFYDVINGIKQVASTIRELDTAYTEMRKVSDESAQSLKNFQKESFSTADSVGTTALAMQDATATWMRLGESLDDAKESAKDATVLLNVSEFDNIDEATDSLVAMSQAYKELDKMEIIDVLDKIGNEYSISTDQLSTALKDSAAVLKTQGNDLAESVALITAGNAITQDASKTAGETLPERYRNIFYRTYLTARAA